jgi:hypothetical protein
MSTQFSKKTVQGKVKTLVLLAVMLGGVGSLLIPSQQASASHQSAGIWANAVNACAIDEADLNEYTFSPNRLTHKPGVVGPIVVRCNVENLPLTPPGFGDVNGLELVYRDPDGPGTASRVVARLQQLTNSGTVVTLATVDSNTGPTSPAFQSLHTLFPHGHDFNFINNAYYVEVVVSRSNAQLVPAAAIVRLIGIVF